MFTATLVVVYLATPRLTEGRLFNDTVNFSSRVPTTGANDKCVSNCAALCKEQSEYMYM